jgi:hypothetical protein
MNNYKDILIKQVKGAIGGQKVAEEYDNLVPAPCSGVSPGKWVLLPEKRDLG